MDGLETGQMDFTGCYYFFFITSFWKKIPLEFVDAEIYIVSHVMLYYSFTLHFFLSFLSYTSRCMEGA